MVDERTIAAITTVVESVGNLADLGHYESLEQLYADSVRVDYTSLTGGEPETKTSRQLMTEWASVLPGFDRTRHAISNIVVDASGDSATATADVVAMHWAGDMHWEVMGDYRFELQRDGTRWRITAHTFNLTSERGTRDVFGPARERAKLEPVPYLIRQQTE